MINLKSSTELKAIAKEKSLDKYGTLILANILIFAIQFIVVTIATVSNPGNLVSYFINKIIFIIVNILVGILVSGKAYLYMNLIYSQTVSTDDIFFGFKQHPSKAVVIQAVFVVADLFVSVPLSILYDILLSGYSLNAATGVLFALAFGIVINVYVYLTYSQAFFLLHDFPDRSAKELLALSKKMMKGSRLHLLYIRISFIPLILLGVITLFVPLFWISVYRYATFTAFYQDLIVQYSNRTQPVEGA